MQQTDILIIGAGIAGLSAAKLLQDSGFGVLVLEAMCQAGCFLVLSSVENPMEKNMFFSSLSDSRFRHPIIPGDQLRLEMVLEKFRLGTALLAGKAYVDDKLVAEGRLKATVVEREKA